MKIGIDIDGVIYNTENEFRSKAELYDLLELHKKGQVNHKFWAQERYDWTEKEKAQLKEKYFVSLSKNASLMPGAKEVIELLKQDGHELYIITARGGDLKQMRFIMEEKLEKENLQFSKYYWAVKDKLEICKKEHLDLMIDDSAAICKTIAEHEIKTLYFRDVNREKLEETKYLKEVNTWGEVYRQIIRWNGEEK